MNRTQAEAGSHHVPRQYLRLDKLVPGGELLLELFIGGLVAFDLESFE